MSENQSSSDFNLFDFMNMDLSIEERAEDLLKRLTVKEKISLLHNRNPAIPRLNIPDLRLANESLHGLVRPGKNTVFPMSIAFGATWNPDLIEKVGCAISDEARAHHNDNPKDDCLSFWAPTINMARHPLWGRTPETYGEDPFLTSKIGVSYVKGMQGYDPRYLKVQASPKHYVGNNHDAIRDKCWTNINMTNLRNYYLPAFKAAVVDGHCECIMGAYNAVFGEPCCASKLLLTTILRDEWGFPGYDGTGGFVVTDCSAINNYLWPLYHITNSRAVAVAMSYKAGIDYECGHNVRHGHMYKAYKKGLMTEEDIDVATRRVLRTRFKLGLFDPPEKCPYSKIGLDVVACKEHNELALKVAEESIVLLKNEHVSSKGDNNKNADGENKKPLLPINLDENLKIAVVGKNAGIAQLGDYAGIPKHKPVSGLVGLKKKFKNCEIDFVQFIPQDKKSKYELIPAPNLLPSDDCKKYVGLKRESFAASNFRGTPAVSVDQKIDFFWGKTEVDASISNANTDTDGGVKISSDDQEFSIKWSGYLCPPLSGIYQLKLKAKGKDRSNKASLVIDGKIQRLKCKIEFEAGKAYPIEIKFPSVGKNSKISLEWILPKQNKSNSNNFEREVKAAKNADLVIAFAGLDKFYERESIDRANLKLPEDQSNLLRKVYAANSNMVLVLIAGSPLAINWENENIPSILMAWYPAERGGDAIANVLSGEVCPGGKLPLTFYTGMEQCIPIDEYDISLGQTYQFLKKKPLYPFGYGISYTQFEYSDFDVQTTEFNAADEEAVISVNFSIKNIGSVKGDEIAQVYVSYPNNSDIGDWVPIKQLKGFKRVPLESGESKNVEISINLKDLMLYDDSRKNFQINKGEYIIKLGKSCEDVLFQKAIKIN